MIAAEVMVTEVRGAQSHWRVWVEPERRCRGTVKAPGRQSHIAPSGASVSRRRGEGF